jgi:hypothetical protein
MTTVRLMIVDMDNCLSDDSWRTKYLPQVDGMVAIDQYGFNTYHSLALMDKPCFQEDFKRAYHALRASAVIVLTSRPGWLRMATTIWLARHFDWMLEACVAICMRDSGDLRRSTELKLSMIEWIGEIGMWEIVCAYDDRDDVLDAYRKAGLAAYKANNCEQVFEKPKIEITK